MSDIEKGIQTNVNPDPKLADPKNFMFSQNIGAGMINHCTKSCVDISKSSLSRSETNCFIDCRAAYFSAAQNYLA